MREVREHNDNEKLELVETTNTLVAGELGTVGWKTIVLHSLLVMVFHLTHAVRIPFGSTVQNF